MPQTLTGPELNAKLREILETWPLYRDFTYLGADEVDTLPQTITLHCSACKHDQLWQRHDPTASDRGGFFHVQYQCKNCESRDTHFLLCWYGTRQHGRAFVKVGQYPALEERIPLALEQALKGDDLEFYRRALRCRNFNFGIAALAYLRRVVENRMNDLLDLIAEAARQAGYDTEELKKLADVKASRVFDNKVSYGATILPPSLRPGGANPIDLLHDLASEGLHRLSDAECIDMFDRSRTIFEHVFIELKVKEQKDKTFAEALSKLQRQKGSPGPDSPK